ncbi:hypothetical protein [Angustibacter speluncae]
MLMLRRRTAVIAYAGGSVLSVLLLIGLLASGVVYSQRVGRSEQFSAVVTKVVDPTSNVPRVTVELPDGQQHLLQRQVSQEDYEPGQAIQVWQDRQDPAWVVDIRSQDSSGTLAIAIPLGLFLVVSVGALVFELLARGRTVDADGPASSP